ncbi:GGDEF domain-containing response regulator [Catenovulum sediminis]|uniref:GGDEF domain-containing response regulator n=1 Tax=Catenovulum sediminis TaxID=1740262 RepID=UPI00163DD356|nr:diguanylate cyclase [Catenovulum sediminis]
MRNTILVIDDSETDRIIIERYLSQAQESFEVICYPEASSLEGILKMVHIDCVLIDFNMPNGNGLKCISAIKDISPYTGVILVTGFGDEKLASEAFKAGVDDYLSKKDFSQSRLTSIVSNVVSKKRIEREHHNANAELELLRTVVDNTPNLIMVCDPETSLFITFNLALNRFLQLPSEHIKSKSYFHVSQQFKTTDEWYEFVETVKKAGHYKFETELTRGDDTLVPFELDCCFSNVGEKSYLLFSGMDISRLKQVQHELLDLATKDPLTQLRNRRGLAEEFKRIYKSTARESGEVCLALFDIDDFKQVNDQHGHDVGDEVLVQFADVMRSLVRRPLDIIARAGGEEFIVIISDGDRDALVDIIRQIIKKAPNEISPKVTVSAGAICVKANNVELTFEKAFKIADENLYQSKHKGKNQANFSYDESI